MLCSAPDFASSSLSEMGNTAGSVPVRYNDQIIRDLAKTSGLCESEVSQRSEDYYQGVESRYKKYDPCTHMRVLAVKARATKHLCAHLRLVRACAFTDLYEKKFGGQVLSYELRFQIS